jgi:putative transcriptional regulator
MKLNTDIFRIKTNNVKPRKGRILIAEPFLPGSYFNRSIVLLTEHNHEGSVGFILNKPVDFPVDEFYTEFPGYKGKIYLGGPVNIDSLYYIHCLGDIIPNSIKIAENLYWGGDYKHLKTVINTGIASKKQVRFFLGYSGWDKDQLKEELNEDSWLVGEINHEAIFQSTNKLWKDMVIKQGGKYSLWQNYPENPSMN